MTINDWMAIAAFAISIMGMVFALGGHAERLKSVEKSGCNLEDLIKRHDDRLDRLSEIAARTSTRLSYVEERIFGDDTAARMRDM